MDYLKQRKVTDIKIQNSSYKLKPYAMVLKPKNKSERTLIYVRKKVLGEAL